MRVLRQRLPDLAGVCPRFSAESAPRPAHLRRRRLAGGQVLDAADNTAAAARGAWDAAGSVATRETQPLREVASVRQGPTRMAKLLPTGACRPGGLLDGRQPAVAVVGGGDDDSGLPDLKHVRVYSLAAGEYVHALKFHGEVHGVAANRRCRPTRPRPLSAVGRVWLVRQA